MMTDSPGTPNTRRYNSTQRWQQIANDDLLNNAFNEPLEVRQGLCAFEESDAPLSEASYRAQCALYNAVLINECEQGFYHFTGKKFQDFIIKFDALIGSSKTLTNTPSLIDFQRYAKSCLYYRIGDFLLLSLKQSLPHFDQSQLMAALCSYAIALDYLCRDADRECCSAAEAFAMIELYVLISANLHTGSLSEMLSSGKLKSLILSIVFDIGKPGGKLFVEEDIDARAKQYRTPKIDLEKLLNKIWGCRQNTAFLKKIIWIRCNVDNDNYLDTAITRFPKFPHSLSLNYTANDFTVLDLKILLLRISNYFELTQEPLENKGKKIVLPPHFYPSVRKSLHRVWTIVNDLCDFGPQSHNSKRGDQVHFVSAMEEIRCDVAHASDRRNLLKVAVYLSRGIRNRNVDIAKVYSELTERYASAALGDLSTLVSPLFPPLNTDSLSSDMKDDGNFLLANIALSNSEFDLAEAYIDQMSASRKEKESVQSFLMKVRERNSSPSSCDSFQMVNDFNETVLQPIDDSLLEDSQISEESFVTARNTSGIPLTPNSNFPLTPNSSIHTALCVEEDNDGTMSTIVEERVADKTVQESVDTDNICRQIDAVLDAYIDAGQRNLNELSLAYVGCLKEPYPDDDQLEDPPTIIQAINDEMRNAFDELKRYNSTVVDCISTRYNQMLTESYRNTDSALDKQQKIEEEFANFITVLFNTTQQNRNLC